MKITSGKVVSIDYTLTDDEKNTIDSSKGGEALAYLHGSGQIIKGLEKALEGRSEGDTFKVRIAPEDGYGMHDPGKTAQVPREQLKDIPNLEVGMQLQASGDPSGHGHGVQILQVTKIEDDKVTLDANHPLAGKNLNFDIEIKTIREASEEEIALGHVHGPGGHHHH
ncbi:MAG: peptidylprolyl isomerase [Chthoniobacterales bacterium]